MIFTFIMPPKRKAAAAKKAPAKKAKVEEDDEEAGPSDMKKMVEALKKSNTGKKTHKLDAHCYIGQYGGTVSIFLWSYYSKLQYFTILALRL